MGVLKEIVIRSISTPKSPTFEGPVFDLKDTNDQKDLGLLIASGSTFALAPNDHVATAAGLLTLIQVVAPIAKGIIGSIKNST